MSENHFKPVRTSRLSEEIIRQIAKLVEEGHLKRNARFPSERTLEQRWQVSRPVLREAFRILETQGIVESRPGGGRYLRSDHVPDPARLRWKLLQASRNDLYEVWDAREAVESKAAELAARHATPEQIEAIGRPLRAIETSSPEELRNIDFNREFHLAIAQASGNRLIEEIVSDLLSHSGRVGFKELLDVSDWAKLQASHQPIYDAIARRDPSGARKAMIMHFKSLRQSTDPSQTFGED
jgi:GntR family transcriptional repressor for pyruvate dehydrogenase complex